MKTKKEMASTSHGAHQRGFRRRSLKVLLGAMKVLTMRCVSDNAGAVCGAAAGMELMGMLRCRRSCDCSGSPSGKQRPECSTQQSAFSPINIGVILIGFSREGSCVQRRCSARQMLRG